MQELFEDYIRNIAAKFERDTTTEMGYRTHFEELLKGIFESIKKLGIDHDAKARQGNKPDFAVLKASVPIVYIETKDIGVSLDKVEKSEQMARYYGYANLVLTDYLEFRFYRNGAAYQDPIKIAEYDLNLRTLTPRPENFEHLAKTLVDFAQSHKEPIKSGEHLARIMGGKAQRIRDNVRHFLHSESEKNRELLRLYGTVKKLLVHDLTPDSFADMYAQTLVYGLFMARYHDETPENFTRQEARDLIPSSNPFLRHFFDHIIGPDFDARLAYIVNELCDVFSHADIKKLMQEYYEKDLWGKETANFDPVIHFYEDFLKEYDPVLRKKMGAYYTPLPVVRFIVRSVDYLLEKEFGLVWGLTNTAKLPGGIHRVQILDPAVGTGTFISAVIHSIYKRLKDVNQKGRWPAYVHRELLPRLHGFELMMAPYTIAHLKLSMAFRKTDVHNFKNRLGIYLTNSLEESPIQKDMLETFGLAESIAEESKAASVVKNKMPVMVVLGNPPYSGESSNASYKGNDVYKREPSGGKLQERNSKWLNDDYVKFIRFAESMIEKTGEGVVAMITAHGYLDNPTFRGMRFHLMQTFNEIYVLDLHGNANKKEMAPDGSEDKNVFDIKQGVAILVGVKRKLRAKESVPVKVFRADCFGSRKTKYDFLNESSFPNIPWKMLAPSEPNYEWVLRDEGIRSEYRKGFSIDELFQVSSVGVVTSRDEFVSDADRERLVKRIKDFLSTDSANEAMKKFSLRENKTWKVSEALKHEFDERNIVEFSYRPLDSRFLYYHDDFIERSRKDVMSHFSSGKNLGLVTARTNKNPEVDHFFISRNITEAKLGESSTQSAVFPLYLFGENGLKTLNLQKEIVDAIEKVIKRVTPEEIFDYVYAVLYSPSYREKYKEFLKIDFPRVPYPKDAKTFKKLVALGAELRGLHLMESPAVNRFITTYPVTGNDVVEKPVYQNGSVYINKTQYFGSVPEIAWNFYIGGYQPAQKWLKDRKGRELTDSDLEHYQKIIVVLTETDRVMKEIDKVYDITKSTGR